MPTILCADDAADIRTLVRSVLTRDGIDVVLANNGAEALEAMVRQRPDGVILDINMPLMSGLEVLRRMAEDPELAAIPVMMLTANSQAENVQEALTRGARDFVVKPFETHVLRQRVRRMLDAPHTPVGRRVPSPSVRVGAQVLVVDDQPTILEIASEMLADRFEVVTARSGAGAVAAAARQRPDVVLMDLFMPVMDGAEALARMRELDGMGSTKVLAMGLGSPEEQSLVGQFDGVVHKPLERPQLVRAVCQAIGASGLYSYLADDDLTVLRFFESKLWDPTTGASGRGFWDAADLQALERETDVVLGRALENGHAMLLMDLERLGEMPDHHVGAVLSATRSVAERMRACRLVGAAVVPFHLQRSFVSLRDEFRVEIHWRTTEAVRSLRRHVIGRRQS